MKRSHHWASLHSSQADFTNKCRCVGADEYKSKISSSSSEESFLKSGSIIRPRQLWMNWKGNQGGHMN